MTDHTIHSHTVAALVAIAIAVVVLYTVVPTSAETLHQLCELRAGENFTHLDEPTGNLTTIHCEHPNGTVREVSNLVNSTA